MIGERAGANPARSATPLRRNPKVMVHAWSARGGQRCPRPGDRVVPQRRDLAGTPQGVGGAPCVALPELRGADRTTGQHPGSLLAAAAGQVPALLEPDPGAV